MLCRNRGGCWSTFLLSKFQHEAFEMITHEEDPAHLGALGHRVGAVGDICVLGRHASVGSQ